MQKVLASVEYQGIAIDIEIQIDAAAVETDHTTVRNEALDRIHGVALREAQRFAEISIVDLKDQGIEKEEAKRIAALPKDRPHIIVAAGTKDPAGAVVLRGEYEIEHDGQKRTLKAQPQPDLKAVESQATPARRKGN